MADQFCRIACVGICDMTLDSNGVQTLVTTDANCSFVIRELYKKDSNSSASTCYKGDLVMDGITVLSNFGTQAEGTLIVPPSTTLCYVEKSGNYPLTFRCYCHHATMCAGTNCGGGKQIFQAGVGSSITTSAYLFNYPCITSMCCNNNPERGMTNWQPCTCTYIMYYHDGNSIGNLYMFCKNCTTSSYSLAQSWGTGYCTPSVAKDMIVRVDNNYAYIHNFGRCGNPGNAATGICVCNLGGNGWTTYSESAISMEGHPDHGLGCRAMIEARGNAGTDTNKVFHFDACCSESGCRHKSTLLWCMPRCCTPTNYCAMAGGNDLYRLFVYYSPYCQNWLGGVYYNGCISVLNEDATEETFVNFQSQVGGIEACKVSIAGQNFFWHVSCDGKKMTINLDAMIKGTEVASCAELNTYNGLCGYTYECACDGSGNYCQLFWYGPSVSTDFAAVSCDYPSADEKTCIRIYGIKST